MEQRDERSPHRPGRHASPYGTSCNVNAAWFKWDGLTGGVQLKRGQQLLLALLESPLKADGLSKRPTSLCLQPPKAVHLEKGTPC